MSGRELTPALGITSETEVSSANFHRSLVVEFVIRKVSLPEKAKDDFSFLVGYQQELVRSLRAQNLS